MVMTDSQKYAIEKRYQYLQGFHRMLEPSSPIEVELNRVLDIGRTMDRGFTIDESNHFVYENLIKWIRGDKTMKCHDPKSGKDKVLIIDGNLRKGVYLAGRTGTGKSLCLRVMSKYCEEIAAHYFYHRIMDFRITPLDSFYVFFSFAEGGALDKYIGQDILTINDFGCEPMEANYMGTKIHPMRHIMERRGDLPYSRMTILTSNYPIVGDDIEEQYGHRVQSRLVQMCNYFILGGDDRRRS